MKMRSFLLSILALSVATFAQVKEPLMIAEQGSFAVGGTVKTSKGSYTPIPAEIQNATTNNFWTVYQASLKSGGMTLHGDHASVFYQIPVNAKQMSLIFQHGYGGSIRAWQTTPDGREGF